MKWPFALRSTVDSLRERCDQINACFENACRNTTDARQAAKAANDRVETLHKRLLEIIDPDRTTPTVMAEVFNEWSDGEQADFLNIFGRLSRDWEYPRCMQFGSVAKYLNDEGRDVLRELGQYSEKP